MRAYTKLFKAILLALFPVSSLTAQTISYIIPDIGTPGMNTYVEIIGPHNSNGNFGTDGLYLNNPNDAVQVICAKPADTQFVRFGPCVVSWNGKMISTQAFVLPNVNATSEDWQQGIKIPIQVKRNGLLSNVDTFYIVTPQHIGIITTPGALGSGGAYGTRSRRGAMIVDSMVLSGTGTYTITTSDCDPSTPGNQGFLPTVIIAQGSIIIGTNSTLSVSADSIDGGVGGGGGGDGLVCGTRGGNGFTGGGGCSSWQSGCGGRLSGNGTGIWSDALNNALGGDSSIQDEGGGGGTGSPFGSGGGPGGTAFSYGSPGYGGGTGGPNWGATSTQGGGGGGGYGTDGFDGGVVIDVSIHTSGGKANGNESIIPLAGGSGGGGGNVNFDNLSAGAGDYGAGSGGGAGGCSALFGKSALIDMLVSSGADGYSSAINSGGGGGGGGSGGAIIVGAKEKLAGLTVAVSGGIGGIGVPTLTGFPHNHGQDGGVGGAGRVRVDGTIAQPINFSPNTSSLYQGPSTDTSRSVTRTFTLGGTGNGDSIRLYLRPFSGKWFLDTTLDGYASNTWNSTITLPGTDTLYLLAAVQQDPSPSSDTFSAVPAWVMSQVAANILNVSPCEITTIVLDSTTQQAGHAVHILLSIGGSVVPQNADSIQLTLLYNNDLLSYDSVIRGCVDSVKVQKIDSMHSLVTLYFPHGSILSDTPCMVADIVTTAMVTRSVSTDIVVESLSLSTAGISTQSFTCPVNSSFKLANSCGDSTLRQFMETGTLIGSLSASPNPASEFVTIKYSLAAESSISVTISDVLGRVVSVPIENQNQVAGPQAITFDTKDLPNGLYWCRLSGDGINQSAKIVIGK